MASKKYKITQLQQDETLLELHPATDADIVSVEKGSSAYKGDATNVQDALEEIYDLASTGGVTSVNGKTGAVTLNASDVGAEAAFTDGSATIATKNATTSIITIKGGVKQSAGAISNKTTSEAADITLSKVAATGSYVDLSNKPTIPTVNNGTLTLKVAGTSKATFTANQAGTSEFDVTKTDLGLDNVTNNKQVKAINSSTSGNIVTFGGTDGATIADSGKAVSATAPSSSSTDAEIPTSKAVNSAITAAIDAMPEPMIFKGSVGATGTVTWADLPNADASNEGHTYKVITAHSADTKCPACKVGDTIISNGTAWVVIPSGDEPSGTVTSVGLSAPTGFSVSGSPITGSGTLALTFASGYSLPTTAKQTEWDNKQNALATQTAYTSKGTSTKVAQITTNTLGQVTGITEVDIAFPTANNQTVKAGSTTFGANDVVEIAAGSNVTVTPNATNKTITIAATDTTYESKAAAQGGTAVSLVTIGEKYTWNNKYAKPSGGIPKTDLATAVQTSLGKADTALQANQTITISGDASGSGATAITLTLKNSGVTAGTYSAVAVNAKGIVTAGNNIFEVGSKSGTNTPSSLLAVGGIFYQEI